MSSTVLALLAFLSILLAGVLLVGSRMPAKAAMPIVYAVSALIGLFVWQMSVERILASTLQGLSALVQRGAAYTELALYAQRRADDDTLALVNHLGIALGDAPEEILGRLDRGDFSDADVVPDAGRASSEKYRTSVRDVEADSPARYNADPTRLHEASGCAGKLAVFAVRLDTFPAREAIASATSARTSRPR